jgi:hypothetical protein
MIAICIDCTSANKGKELKTITKSNQLSLHKRIHPDHIIRIIESGDLDKYGFNKREKPYAHHQDRYPSKNYGNLLGELYEEWQSKRLWGI